MKRFYPILLLLLGFNSLCAQTEVYFTSYPSLTPDGATTIFTYEGDLYKPILKIAWKDGTRSWIGRLKRL